MENLTTEVRNLRAAGDKIIVEVDTDETTTKSGIILTSATPERHYSGRVIDLGPDEAVAKSKLKIGDWVFYQRGYNFEFEKNGKKYDVVSIYDVLAVEVK